MSVILSIESATPICSIALHSDGQVLAHSHLFVNQSASSKLAVMINSLLKYSEIQPSQLSAIAVSAGPGSYTGLRIGAATAKGMCYALSIPLIAINTLDSMVKLIQSQQYDYTFLCPMLDARRMEVYCLITDDTGVLIEETQAKIIDESSFQSLLDKGKILFFGSGADKCKEVIKHRHATFVPDVHPSAVQIGELAHKKFLVKEFEDTAEFEPFYLKDFLIKKPKAAF